MDKQQNLTELTKIQENRDYYWGRLVILASSIGAVIVTIVFADGTYFLLEGVAKLEKGVAKRWVKIILTIYYIILIVFLIYYLVQWIIFRNKSQKVAD